MNKLSIHFIYIKYKTLVLNTKLSQKNKQVFSIYLQDY